MSYLDIEFPVFLFSVIANISLAIIVFRYAEKRLYRITFVLFVLGQLSWIVVNYISFWIPQQYWLFTARLTMLFAAMHAFLFFLFIYSFLRKTKLNFRLIVPYLLFLIFIVGASFSTGIFKDLQEISSGKFAPQPGPLMPIFALFIAICISSAFFIIAKRFKQAANNEHDQWRHLSIGLGLTFVMVLAFSFFGFVIFNNLAPVRFGHLYTLPFIVFTAYAITRYGLLNIKAVLAELAVILLNLIIFSEILTSKKLSDAMVSSFILLGTLIVGWVLIRGVRKEIEQRERLEKLTRELEEKNVQLQKLDDFRKQVLSFASHDLKAPISLMKQSATLIYDGTYKDEQKIRDTAFKIKMFADRGVNMIDNFLDIRKMEEGKLEYNFEKKNIVEFAKNITSDFALLAKQKDIDVIFDSPAQDIQSNIDTDKMRQVFQNLLDNSLKYTEAGSVRVSMTEEQNTVLFKIQDTGIGMTSELLPTLFEQFKRASEVKKTIKGTGLGLYISKQIVLAHHGEIWAESEGVGKGSSFFVRLKKA